MFKKLIIGVAVLIGLGVVFGNGGEDASDTTAITTVDDSGSNTQTEEVEVVEEEPAPEPKPEPKPEPSLTSGQENAARSAEQYVSMTGFSRPGLIKQLKFEGYSKKDAEFAVDYLKINWNEQAARSAEAYLDMSGFSHAGLVEQLMFEGYTRKQAEYGAGKAL